MPTRKLHIRIGNQTAFSAATIAEPFIYAVVNGFDAFEWFPDKKASGEGWTTDDIGKKTRTRIRKTATAHDISMSVHIPWQTNPLHMESEDALLSYIDFAQELGASLLNIHLYTEQGIDAYIHAITPLIRGTAKIKMNLAIENTPETTPDSFNDLFRKLIKINRIPITHVGMCLDLGHANLCSATRNNYLEFIDRLSPDVPIIHLHLHENHGDSDSHLTLFTGPAGIDDSGISGLIDRLVKRKYCGNMIMEQWPTPPALLTSARNKLIEMLDKIGN